MASYRDLLKAAKADIREVDPATAEAELGDATFLDVRELDEYEQGMIPGSVFIPRGHLESQAENKLPDRDKPIIIYCAGGNRSAFAARTLQELGYTDVASMIGGFGRWKNEGRDWITPAVLDPEQRTRYSRHLLLPEVGEEGQQKLLQSKVLLLGAGGLGSPAALYLAAAGVGTLGIVDMDVVDESNLQRQILHNMERIGERKVDSAKKTLTALNPDVDVVTYDVRFGADNILDIIDGYDVILDGTDNFPTRYLLNDASLLKRIPVVHGSIFRFEGQVTVFDPYNGPCYPSRRRRSSRRRAPRPACWACCPASSDRSRRSRRSSSCSTSENPSAAGCSRTMHSRRRSATTRCGAIPTARHVARVRRSCSRSTTSTACPTPYWPTEPRRSTEQLCAVRR
jgi:molybdopterin/thiamine biosynthesis adenylyltransferase/rhodanese-related sulfurtransferase